MAAARLSRVWRHTDAIALRREAVSLAVGMHSQLDSNSFSIIGALSFRAAYGIVVVLRLFLSRADIPAWPAHSRHFTHRYLPIGQHEG